MASLTHTLLRRIERHQDVRTLFRVSAIHPDIQRSQSSVVASTPQRALRPQTALASQPVLAPQPISAPSPQPLARAAPLTVSNSSLASFSAAAQREAVLRPTPNSGKIDDTTWDQLTTVMERRKVMRATEKAAAEEAARNAPKKRKVMRSQDRSTRRHTVLQEVGSQRSKRKPTAQRKVKTIVADPPPAGDGATTSPPSEPTNSDSFAMRMVANPEQNAEAAQLDALMRQVAPAEATSSPVEVVMPRGARPKRRVQRRESAEPPPSEPTPQVKEAAPDMVATEIGDLPSDLWTIMGESPPVAREPALSTETQSVAEGASVTQPIAAQRAAADTAETSVQRADASAADKKKRR